MTKKRRVRRARLVVGVDGSDRAAAALEWAIDLARRLDAEVVAVHALQVPTYISAPYDLAPPAEYLTSWMQQLRDETRDRFQSSWSAPLARSGLPYRTILQEGRPAGVIAAVADRERADLVVVGRRGHSAVAELLMGSVSHELTHHSRRPVVVVPGKRGRAR